MADQEARTALDCEPYSYREVRAVADSLGLSEPVAIILVRRGYRTPEAARDFLTGKEEHDPLEFDSMAEISARLLSAARDGTRITVHGDYDVDGVSSTAILVRALRELGATCDWLIPDRASDGYGLTMGTVEALAGRGTELLVTADCGIGSAAEVAAARERGIETIVTDHHQPPQELPACPILHPVLSGYPFGELCATGVAHKLATALRREASIDSSPASPPGLAGKGSDGVDRIDLDLVALATVADMVPLVGENRRLVREGLAEARRGASPGLRALMAVSKSDPATLGAGDLGFRIAPRINAAGRLYRADAGVELLLTEDPARASEIATELDRANAERRATEREVMQAAERELRSQDREAPAIVLAGEGWHAGVVGIVASRLVERYWRPVVLIALEGNAGRGSGRSIRGFDLVAALSSCAAHLGRFGGHAAAAGLSIEADSVDDFREALIAYAAKTIAPEQLVRTKRVDALVGVGSPESGGIGMGLAEELERLGPFGSGNPEPRLLIPAAQVRGVQPLGESGNHARFQIESGAGSAMGVGFNVGSTLEDLDGQRSDLLVRLEVDRWNGAVQPRVVLDELLPLPDAVQSDPTPSVAAITEPACSTPAELEEWWRRLEAELETPLEGWPGLDRALAVARAGADREPVDRQGGALVAAIAELLSSGGSVLALCADAARRSPLLQRAAGREGGDLPESGVACSRCSVNEARATLQRAHEPGGLALADWPVLCREPEAVRAFEHIVLLEPPPFEHLERLAAAAPVGGGYLHLAWSEDDLEVAERLLEHEWALRPHVADLYRAVSAAGPERELTGETLIAALAGGGRYPRTPELAGRCLRVMVELGLGVWERDVQAGMHAPCLRVVSSEATELERSAAFNTYRARHEEGKRFLRKRRQPETLKAAA